MKIGKIVIIVVITLMAVGIYLLLRPKTNMSLPECKYGPTDAVLNKPCEQTGFHP